jgi:hypothetical protein
MYQLCSITGGYHKGKQGVIFETYFTPFPRGFWGEQTGGCTFRMSGDSEIAESWDAMR